MQTTAISKDIPKPPSEHICVKGINWGRFKLEEKHLTVDHNNESLLKIPFSKIINSSVLNKHEVVLEFKNEDQKEDEDILCEMRFYIPPTLSEGPAPAPAPAPAPVPPQPNSTEKENSEMEIEAQTQAELFNQEIFNKAHMGQFSSECIATFPEIPLVVPRGRYAADLFKDCIRFHGNTFNYRIEFKSIDKAFLLPKPDDVHMIFILALKSPIRQGNTNYPYIVMQFKKDAEEEIKIKLKPEQIKEYYGDNLKEEYSGPTFDLVSKLFKIIVGVNIIIPGNFKSSAGYSGLRCSLKAHEGFLFPLQKSLLFIVKPVIYLKLEEISVAEFHRVNKGTSALCKLFDLELKQRGKNYSQTFVGIDKQEFQLLVNYFETRKVKVQIVEDQVEKDDDNRYEDSDEDDDGNRKRKRRPVTGNEQKMIDFDDESDDESYHADENEESSSNGEDDDESESFEEEQKKKKIKK